MLCRSEEGVRIAELFIERTRIALGELMGRRLEDVRLAMMMLDGLAIAERTNVVALRKHHRRRQAPARALGGSTENATLARTLLADLVDRGLDPEQAILFVIDLTRSPGNPARTTLRIRLARVYLSVGLYGAHDGGSGGGGGDNHVMEEPWYARLREEWRPTDVRVLLVAESAPDPGAANRRFFYAPTLTGADNLYRGVVQAFYDQSPGTAGDPKAPWLKRLRNDGVYLIDLCPFPVNKLSSRDRRLAHREHTPALVERAVALEPSGVIVCHGPTFNATAGPLRTEGLRVLHNSPIPFPLGNWRDQFIAAVREALTGL